MTHVINIDNWWPVSAILADLSVPGSADNLYNVISYNLWTYSFGAVDSAIGWSNAAHYLTTTSQYGTTTDEIQKNIVSEFHKAGKKVLVTAFGSTEHPTSMGYKPRKVGKALAEFVIKNHLDGVDIQYKDTAAFIQGTAEDWLVELTSELRQHLPNHIISHSASNFYFKPDYFVGGGYGNVHKRVGNTISFYGV